MFRTVFITKGQYLTIKDEWLLINYGDTVKKVPLSDIKNLFIDNVYINISAYALQKLAKYGINAILCAVCRKRQFQQKLKLSFPIFIVNFSAEVLKISQK